VRNVIFVHGFWHGSWCWSLVAAHLAGRGVPSVAVDLDGHGLKSRSPASRWDRPFQPDTFATDPSGVAAVTTSSAAATLVEQVRVIGGGEPCVVVVHSMSGTVVTAAAELEPSLFSHLVYVCAFAPVTGVPAAEYVSSPQNEGSMVLPLLVADPAVVGAVRIDPGDPGRHARIREAFYGDVDDATAKAAISLLGTDAPVGIPAEAFSVTPGRYGTVAHTYVMCTKDNAIPIALQRRFVDEINAVSAAPTVAVELDSGHSPFLSQPAELAAVIAESFGRDRRK
jgi:pimeloyl-ACP methyl ester carboxylesterase